MKKILLLACCFGTTVSFAQNGFYLQPIAGIGATNVNHTDFNDHMTSGNYAVGFDAGVLAGYQSGNWRFNAGLEYLRTATAIPITITNAQGDPIASSAIQDRYSHIVLPVMAGRTFRVCNKTSFTPSIGAGISYNIALSERIPYYDRALKMPSEQFKHEYHPFSCFGMMQAELDYHISSRLSITCAPAFNYMLTNMYKPSANPYFSSKEYHYCLLLNAGVKWQFEKKKKTETKTNQPE